MNKEKKIFTALNLIEKVKKTKNQEYLKKVIEKIPDDYFDIFKYMIRFGFNDFDKSFFNLKNDKNDEYLINILAKNKKMFSEEDVLFYVDLLKLDGTYNLAHFMAKNGFVFKNEKILKMKDEYGYSVAHIMAFNKHIFTDLDILRIKDQNDVSVAHMMAKRGYCFDNKEVLSMQDKNKYTVAHLMAEQSNFLDEYEYEDILLLKNIYKDSVAHVASKNGYYITNPRLSILKNMDSKHPIYYFEKYCEKEK